MTPRRQPKHRPKLGAMSVSLLNELLTNTLDQGYAAAARRREQGGRQVSRRRGQLVAAVGLLLAGLLCGMGFAQARQSAPESARVKLALIHDIDGRTADSDALEHQLERLVAQVARDRDAALAASQQGEFTRTTLQQLESENGLLAVRGPGLEVTLGDAPPREETNPVTGQQQTIQPDENGRITDRDLQIVVNALWAAGAEAISIDGRRITSTTTIREAGGAILVDFYAVTTPYAIEAIGDPDRLLPRFVDGRTAQQYQTYVGAYQIQFDVQRRDEIQLRAAAGLDVQHASVLPESTPAGTSGSPGTSASPGGSGAPAPTGGVTPSGSGRATPSASPPSSGGGT